MLGSSLPEVFLGKGVRNICSKFTGEHPCRSAISRKLLCNFIEIALRHGCSPVNLLHIFRTPFPKNTSGGLLLGAGCCCGMSNAKMYLGPLSGIFIGLTKLNLVNCALNDNESVIDAIACHFCNHPSAAEINSKFMCALSNVESSRSYTNPSNVAFLLKFLDIKKASGVGKIPPKLVKVPSDILSL